jgi:taurine--2-oxoglutarate transaminase
VQGAVDPIAVDRAEGVYLYTPEGDRILDFNSQLMSINIGHGDRRVIDAITEQATRLQYVQPAFATEIRARLGQKLAQVLPGDLDKVFFTLGGAEAIENAIKLARHYTGRYKVLARYRSYHGATMGAMSLTGDPRRWPNEPGLVGVVRYPDTHRWGEKEPRPVAESLQGLEDVIRYEGPQTIAAVFLETIVGTNGILIPPDGYIQGVREICDRYDILMVADEVMAGFGRTGRWFAIDHWDTVPDLMTMAKGLTSSYLPLGAVAMNHKVADKFESMFYSGGLTYSSHPVSLAAALATIGVYEEDDLIGNAARMGEVMRGHHERLAAKHPSVGATRSLGLFGILDLVRSRDPWTPLTPFNGTADEMKAIGRFFRQNGLYTMVINNSIHTNPPLCINEEQLADGFEIIDRALDLADQAVTN